MDVSLCELQEMVRDRQVWHCSLWGCKELDTTEQLNNNKGGKVPKIWGLLSIRNKVKTGSKVKERKQGSIGFPGGISGKEPATSAGDMRDVGSVPGLARAPDEEFQPTPDRRA